MEAHIEGKKGVDGGESVDRADNMGRFWVGNSEFEVAHK